MLLIFSLYLIYHKMEANAVNVFYMFNMWFFNECIIKWKVLEAIFLFLIHPKNSSLYYWHVILITHKNV